MKSSRLVGIGALVGLVGILMGVASIGWMVGMFFGLPHQPDIIILGPFGVALILLGGVISNELWKG